MPTLTSKGRVVVSRRRGADDVSTLAMRRRWFADDLPDGADGDGGDDQSGRDAGGDWSALPTWAREQYESLQARLSEVNQESAARRHLLKENEERMARLERDRQQRMTVEEQLKEAQAQMDGLRQFEERSKSLEARIKASNAQRVEAIPEGQRALVPMDELSPEQLATWLDRNEGLLRKPIAPSLDGGAGGQSPKQVTLSEDEKKMASRFGMTPEEWVKYKEQAGL